jgi:hypothetical protein
MLTNRKKYIISGIILALLGLVSYKLFAKPKVAPPVKKKKGSIVIDEGTGSFELPAEVTTKSGTRLRSDSNTNSSILKTYNAGVNLLVIGDVMQSDGQWFKVTDSGNSGWVRSDVVDYTITQDEGFSDLGLQEYYQS